MMTQRWMGFALLLCISGCATRLPALVGGNTINLTGNCVQREEDGYKDNLQVQITSNVVQSLNWTANPRQGQCRFNLNDFKQVKQRPQIDLQHKLDAACHIYIWNNASYTTVSTLNCQKTCAVNEHVLPVLLDNASGQCKK